MRFTTCLTYIMSASVASYGMITSYLMLFVNHPHESIQSYPSEVAIDDETMITTSKPTTTLKISTTQHNKAKSNPKTTAITTMQEAEFLPKTKIKMIKNVTDDPTIFETSKYLLYGSTSGWANQLKSLEHAYWIAFATNRTLVLPPVLYHYDAIQKTYKDIEFKISKNKNKKNKKTTTKEKKKRTNKDDQNEEEEEEEEVEDSVSYYYNNLLIDAQNNPKKKRMRMASILDFDSWTNPVPVIDYETFVMDLKRSRTKNNWKPKLEEFSVDNKFSCHYIKLTMNISKNDIEETENSCQDHIGYHKTQPHTYKYRHIPTYLDRKQKYDIWSFQFIYPHALFDLESMPSSLFQIHYTKPIRTARLELVKSWGKYQEYASIHIRGNDGPFKKSDWSTVIPNLVERTYQSIINYDYINNKNINDNVHNEKHHYTLVVVSDLPSAVWKGDDTSEKSEVYTIWKEEEHKLIDKLRKNNNTNIELNVVITGNDNFYQNITNTLQQNLDGSYEAGVYFDQLLAACADISFVGSNVEVSTFQQRIVSMRKQPSSPCL